jgi:hypothetical protein
MPEPVLAESITDVDATQAGELEIDAIGATFQGARGAAGAWATTVESEWRATDRLGVSVGGSTRKDASARVRLDARAGVSFLVLHDLAHDFHVQAEVSARFEATEPAKVDPSDTTLPVETGLRWGVRSGPVTIRGGLGAEAGGRGARLPFWNTLALLVELGGFGFTGLELLADWARPSPVSVAPEVLGDARSFLPVPVQLGVGVPLVPAARGEPFTVGVLARLLVELN